MLVVISMKRIASEQQSMVSLELFVIAESKMAIK